MFAALNVTKLLAWEGPRDNPRLWSSLPTAIVPGERVGDIALDMTMPEVASRLGSPCETQHFKAEDLAETLKFFAYMNKMTGQNLTAKDAFPLRPAKTYLNYDRLGLSIVFENDRVSGIHVYTGVLSGYDKESKSFFDTKQVPPGASFINTLNEVRNQFGMPDDEYGNEFAPIPYVNLKYKQGVIFDGRADDGRLAVITVMKRKS
jgi:hypothetical protein